jgi:hypothetical protein
MKLEYKSYSALLLLLDFCCYTLFHHQLSWTPLAASRI